MERIQRKAYAKINLSLDVTGKRENGYHDVDMVMASIGLYDELQFDKQADGIRLECVNRKDLSCGEDNLIVKAVKCLKEHTGFQGGVRIRLEKKIPMAAGMAGGSTDCAATLLAVNELYQLGLSIPKLCELGTRLGADVPFCILGGTARARGIGEVLEQKENCLNPSIVLIKPTQGASTKEVYTALDAKQDICHPDVEGMLDALRLGDLEQCCAKLGNVLEPVTEGFLPEVGEIRRGLMERGAKGAMMSGSGPTVFALFEDCEKAKLAAEWGKSLGSGYFACVTGFVSQKERGIQYD